MSERRAEHPVISTEPAKGRIPGISLLPRESRIPILGVRLLLAGLTAGLAGIVAQEAFKMFTGSGSSIAEAAGCKNTVLGLTFLYAQDPERNPDNLAITYNSYVIPIDIPNFGPAVLVYRKDPQDSKSPKKEYSTNLESKGDHAEAIFQVDEDPNIVGSSGRPALRLDYSFDDDPIIDPRTGTKPSRSLILECGEQGFFTGGKIASSNIVDRVAKSPGITGLRKVGNRVDEIVREVLRRRPRFIPPVGKPEDNLRLFKQQAEQIKKSSEEIKGKEKERAMATAQATAVVVPTASATRIPVATGGVATAIAGATKAAEIASSALGTALAKDPAEATKVVVSTVTVVPPTRTPVAPQSTPVASPGALPSPVAALLASGEAAATQAARFVVTAEALGTQTSNTRATVVAAAEAVAKISPPKFPGSTGQTDGSIPVLSGLWEWAKFVADLPAKGADHLPVINDTQPPVRWGINVLGWLLIVTPQRIPILGYLGKPRTYLWRSVRFPLRYRRALLDHAVTVRAAVAAGNPPPPFVRPKWV